MKERRFLKNETIGARAEPDWDKFMKAHCAAYVLSPAAGALLAENPGGISSVIPSKTEEPSDAILLDYMTPAAGLRSRQFAPSCRRSRLH
ncbi:hypothetical protein RLDS_25185 [Sphingobium lactosutens DS20]|jgi:hypothetical protein|uniref:Uncharacterized protein n=1 Tax=Sphingobium lactosutens DS20 TaxID=1331060 RepID=T0H2X3_9SPHN|nr:hypothetical protein RLDS_25185 [Sphingobium lactosutens DS20]